LPKIRTETTLSNAKGLAYVLSQCLRVRLGGEPALGEHSRAIGNRIVPLGSVILFAL